MRSRSCAVLFLVLVLVGCSNEKAGTRPPTNVNTSAAPGAPVAPGAPAGPGGPTTTFKNTPQCNAVRAFNLAGYYATQAAPDKVNDHIATAQRGADEAKAQVPALASDIDTTMTLLKKSLAKQTDEADKATNDKVAKNINTWVDTNCS